MELKCTKEEFKILMDLVYAGNVLVNGTRNYDERIKEYSDMEQKLFALAKEFGFEDLAEFDEEYNEYMPTREYEESEINEHIDNYDDNVFWEELSLRLARRDALNILADEEPDMSKQKLAELQLKLEDEYEIAFSEGEFANLKLIKTTPQEEVSNGKK